jgi:serine/threonine-protein kinase
VTTPQRIGRYILFDEVAAGGMAVVHFGRQYGSAGFARIVAIKRLHPHLAKDADFTAMFLDEARIAARVRHANVVSTIDVVSLPEGEILIVMDYVLGESLSRLLKRVRENGDQLSPECACGIVCDVLHGLHAAHEAKSESGEALSIVHRDVSPHNVLVGADGIARIVDFGVAKARGRIHATQDGQVKGKLGYMAPEQLRGQPVDRRCDVFAAGVVLWEALAARRLFAADSEGETVTRVLEGTIEPPSRVAKGIPPALDAVVLRALARDPAKRFDTAQAMAAAIEAVVPVANARVIASWVHEVAGETIDERARHVAELERRDDTTTIANVSISSDAPAEPRRRSLWPATIVVLAILAVAAGATFAWKRAPNVQVAVAPPAVTSSAPVEIVDAAPPATASVVTAPSTTTAAPKKVPRRFEPITPSTTAPASSEHCPIKTFTGPDGIVQFRRDCTP